MRELSVDTSERCTDSDVDAHRLTTRLWQFMLAANGNGGYQGQPGGTAGQTANMANSTAPSLATLSNVATSYSNIGGRFLFNAVAGAETDFALFGYQNPATVAGVDGRNLYVRGIWADAYVLVVAVAGTPTILEFFVAVDSTAISLATSESGVAKAPRRIWVGAMSFLVGDVVGKTGRVSATFDCPLVVAPGAFLVVGLRIPVGTATPTQQFRGGVGVDTLNE